MKRFAFALPLALAACGQDAPAPTPSPTPTVAAPRTLLPADFDSLELGGRIAGPQGAAVETVLSAGDREIGKMVSYVACPVEVSTCNPAALPAGTVYTYVHRVTLADAETPADAPSALPAPSAATTAAGSATLFRTTRPVPGFNHAVGYSQSEAQAALGVADGISVTSDAGQLIWRVTQGDGWAPGTTITFWWTSTVPPQGPEQAYVLEIDGQQAVASGPFPPPVDEVEKP